MKKNTLIVLLSILFFLAFWISANSEPYKEPVSSNIITVKNQALKALPQEYNFVGVNWFDYFCQNRLFLKDKFELNELGTALKNYNIDFIRYPGGLNVLSYYWDIPNDKKLAALRKLPKSEQSYITEPYMSADDEMNFPSLMEFSKQHNLKSTIQINIHSYYDKQKNEILFLKKHKYNAEGKRIQNSGIIDWTLVEKSAKSAAEQVKWVKENGYSDYVKLWEMGNEDYVFNMFLNCGYTGEEYAKICAIFMREMLKADPNIKFMLTSVTYPQNYIEVNIWFTDFLNKWTNSVISSKELQPYKNNIYSFSRHIYGLETKKDASFSEFLESNLNENMSKFENLLAHHVKKMNEAGFQNRAIFVNEFNVNNFQNKYMHNWLSALNLAKLILIFSKSPNVEHIDYHNLLHQWGNISHGYGLFNYAKDFEGMKFLPYPAASVISFMNQNIKGEVVQTNSPVKDIYVSASKPDKNTLNIILVNKSIARNINIKLDAFNGYKYKSNSSLGANLPYSFESFEKNDDRSNPTEVRLINKITNGIAVSQHSSSDLTLEIPKNSIVSIKLEKTN
jgi:hypothetical protein